jgi:hypothetical protein
MLKSNQFQFAHEQSLQNGDMRNTTSFTCREDSKGTYSLFHNILMWNTGSMYAVFCNI